MIVGIDPGTTVGLAFLDLDGNVVDIESGKNLSVGEIIWEIRAHGDVLILACDRNPAPRSFLKIAANFDCLLFIPNVSLNREEKMELVRGYELENNHEKDALAAARKAFNAYSSKLRHLKRRYAGDETKIVHALTRKKRKVFNYKLPNI